VGGVVHGSPVGLDSAAAGWLAQIAESMADKLAGINTRSCSDNTETALL
jgi:hypothetical protein